MNTTQRYSSKVTGDKLLQKRTRSNLPLQGNDKNYDPRVSQKNLQKTNPRMISSKNQRQEKQVQKEELHFQMMPQHQMQMPMMFQQNPMAAGIPQMNQGYQFPQHAMPPMTAPTDYQSQIAALQQQISYMAQMSQLQAQVQHLQSQAQLYVRSPSKQQVPQESEITSMQDAAFKDEIENQESTKQSPNKQPGFKKAKKDKSISPVRKDSPIHEKATKQKKGQVEQNFDTLSRQTRSCKIIEQKTPIKKIAGNQLQPEKTIQKLAPSANNSSSQGTIATKASLKTPVKNDLQKPVKQTQPKEIVQSSSKKSTRKHDDINSVRRSSRFQTTGSQQLMSLENKQSHKKHISPVKEKEVAKKTPIQSRSQKSVRSNSSSPQVVRRSMRIKHSPPKEYFGVKEETKPRKNNSRSNTPIMSQDQGNEESSKILQHLREELQKTEKEHKYNVQAKKEREQIREQKRESRQNSSEQRMLKQKKVLPPTQDELLLFGDVIKQTNLQSEIDKINPLETGKPKFEAQTEIIQKNYMSQDFTDDEDDKDIQMQLKKETNNKKEQVIYDDEQMKDYGMLFGLKEDEVQAMAQLQKSQIESVRDESILFGDGLKSEVKTIQKKFVEEESAPEHIILSQNTQSMKENTNQNNDEALLFGLPKSNEDAQMKNEEDAQVSEIASEFEKTISEHQSVEEITIIAQTKIDTPQKVSAEMKISDIDRQIQEIQKAIAIQKEVTARKMKEKQDADNLKKEAEREEAQRIIEQKEEEEQKQREILKSKYEEEERLAQAKKEEELKQKQYKEELRQKQHEEELRQQQYAEEMEQQRQANLEAQRQEEAENMRQQQEKQKMQELLRLEQIQLEKQKQLEQLQAEEQRMREKQQREQYEAEIIEKQQILRRQQQEIQRQEFEKQKLQQEEIQRQELIKEEQEKEYIRQQDEQRQRQEDEDKIRQQIENQRQILAQQQQENELRKQIEVLRAKQAEQQSLKDKQDREEREKQEEMDKLIKQQELVRQQQQTLIMLREQKVKERLQELQELKEQQIEQAEREAERARNELKEQQIEQAERARMQLLNNQSQSDVEIISDDKDMNDESSPYDNEDEDMYEHIKPQPVLRKAYSVQLKETIPLKEQFELLYKFQTNIDLSINILISRQQVATFTRIKETVEKQMFRQFNLSHFQQILQVAPQLYNHKWEVKYDKFELVFQIPLNTIDVIENNVAPSQQHFQKFMTSHIIHPRSKFFRKQLANIMLENFEEYRVNTQQLTNFNIEHTQRWPTMFDINDDSNIKPIGLAQFRDQPKDKSGAVSVNDFLMKHDTKHDVDQLIKTAQEADKVQKEAQQANYRPLSSNSDRDSSEYDNVRGEQFNIKHGISDATLNAIQHKQDIQKQQRQKSQDTIDIESKQKKIEQMVKLSEMIKSQFQFAQGHTLYFGKIIENMLNSHRGNFISKDHLKEQVITLCKILPYWIQIKAHSQGELIKCHKNMKLSGFDIKQKVTEYFTDKVVENIHDARISKSCPPIQNSATSQSANQIQNQSSGNAFKQQSAFQPFVRKQSFNQQSEENSQRKEQINRNNFHNHPGGSSVNLSNQGGPLNKQYPDSFNQNQGVNPYPQSSSGTYLSGKVSDADLDQLAQPNHLPSKYLSPLKQMNMPDNQISISQALEGQNSFKYDGMQMNRFESQNQERHSNNIWQQSGNQNYYRSTSMPNKHL